MRSRATLLTLVAMVCTALVLTAGAADAGVSRRLPSNLLDQPVTARTTPAYPYASTFALHSLRGSKHTIFLDFDGSTVLEGSWSRLMLGLPAAAYPGFDLDGRPGSFSAGEQDFIQQVWRRVAESYSPFDVDVTTQEPGPGALSRTLVGDDTYGVQVAITSDPDIDELACGRGSTCSGIARTDAFDEIELTQNQHQPAWVFAANTYPSLDHTGAAGPTAAAVAHEAAHTFGLTHATSAAFPRYYPGHAHWFPIMGQTNNRAIAQWSKGEYAGAAARDDLAGIAAGGAPLRADDYPNHPGGAPLDLGPAATSGSNAFARKGVIGTDADNDYVRFTRRCTGPMLVKAAGIGPGTAVDLKLTLLDSAGKVIATSNPASGQTRTAPNLYWTATGMDASLAFSKAAQGTYRVRVEGVGRGDPASTGYSGYGSIGQYTLTVTRCSTALPVIGKPVAPAIRTARSGKRGKPVNAVARWSVPRSDGGATIKKYRIQAAKVNRRGAITRTYTFTVGPGSSAVTVALPAGRYKFRVAARNRAGTGAYSSYSTIVRAR